MSRDNRCMFVFMSVVVMMWWSVGMVVVYRPLLKIVVLSALECRSILYVCVRDVMGPRIASPPSTSYVIRGD